MRPPNTFRCHFAFLGQFGTEAVKKDYLVGN